MRTSRLPAMHDLIAFEVVARLRSVVRAADELNVTPSAVTHRIRQLEAQTRMRFFENRQFDLTREGVAYLQRVRSAFNILGSGHAGNGPSGRIRLRVAVPPTFSRECLMPILSSFRTEYEQIDLSVQMMIPTYNLRASDADLEIRFGEMPTGRDECIRLQSDQLTPVCSEAFREEFGPLGDFDTREIVARARPLSSPLEPWLPWFSRFALDLPEPEGGFEFNDLGLLYDAAAAGFGVALARLKLVGGWLDSRRLVRFTEFSVPSPNCYFLWAKPGGLGRWECAAFAAWILSRMG